jgi:GGDEF domain-containing protein
VAEAESRLRMQLRDGDEVVRIGDDSFGVLLTVTGTEALEGVVARIREAISEVPVPRRARQLRPHVRALSAGQAADDPELGVVLARLSAPADQRAAG